MNIINLVCGAMASTGVPCDEYHLECVPDTPCQLDSLLSHCW